MTDVGGEIDTGGAEDSPRDFEAEARVQGWKPAEEFTGDPAKHKDAETFVKDGESRLALSNARNGHLSTSLDASNRRYKRLEKDFEQLKGMMTGMEQRAYERAFGELKAKQEAAVESGDVAAFKAAGVEIDKLRDDAKPAAAQKTNKYEPQLIQGLYADFHADNEWFDQGATSGPKKALTLYAGIVADELGDIDEFDGKPEEYFAAIAEKVKDKYGEKYPDMFGGKSDDDGGEEGEKPRRKSAVEGVSGTRGRNAPKTAASLPPDAKAQGQRFVDMGLFANVDAYAKEYFANAG